MLFRMRQPSGPPRVDTCSHPQSMLWARPWASPALRRVLCGPRTETGKLMHGLVPQTAGPSPQTEYLGITYFEDSNADRSSALGLRLNQQNKMKKKNKDIPCEIKMPHVPFAKCSVIETSDFIYFHGLNTGFSGFSTSGIRS